MDYQQATEYLDSHVGLGVHPGLERISALLELMGHPERNHPFIHITGSNGKTSTARFVTALTVAHGYSTGTFISPHLERVEERISMNGVPTTEEQFAQAVTDLAAFVEVFAKKGERPTFFELTAALAFSWFAAEGTDLAAIEVGLGGRLDATNAADGAVAVLTSVSIEHTEYLGPTLAGIATEKLAIAKPDSVLVTGAIPAELVPLAEQAAARVGIPHRHLGREFRPVEVEQAVGGWLFEGAGVLASYPDLHLPVLGRHQVDNFMVAIAGVESLFGRALDQEAVKRGAASATSPGRMELIAYSPRVLLDGAHNPEGFSVLAESLAIEFPTAKWVLVLGVMGEKAIDQMIPPLAGRLARIVATSVHTPRAWAPEVLAERVRQITDVPVTAAGDVQEALAEARDAAGTEHGVLVAGSLSLVGAARATLAGRSQPQRGERS